MSDRDFAATLAKGLDVLACFEQSAQNLTLPEITRRTGLDRAVVRRLCLTLTRCGYLEEGETGLRLAPRVLTLAGGYLGGLEVGRVVQPILRHAAEELDMEVALATRDRLQAVYVDRAAPASARVTLGFGIGSTLPLLHTAVGRMLLARSAPEVLDAALALPARRYSEATDTDPARLRTAIEAAREQGYCIARDEFELGAAGVAVPVGALGQTPFVLATTASVNAFDDPARLDRVLDILRQSALSIGRVRGGR
ncbi:IclR family transcriptional regulator [Pararhodobacter marinus]|uniref:IclR family transcriptional regulator n=1 Tax=Pararhodobacter marinus TaxID=2184063 RepID=A0A2U2CCW1_9RHOB|nr:IclR family transcriptional regulator C-terminal domain-containing protein [Pararhodobacter marinus]PWE29717.1 IclR family transcriptional regulator [Pararhodobacter marinus]